MPRQPQVIQEFVHVRPRRRTRRDAAQLGRSFADLLSPLLPVGNEQFEAGLRLLNGTLRSEPSTRSLPKPVIASGADSLVADNTFARVASLTQLIPGTPEFELLLEPGSSGGS